MSRGTTMRMARTVFALLLCFPLLALTGCSPSYVPAPVVDLDAAQKEAKVPPKPEPEPEPAPEPKRRPAPVVEARPEFYDVKSGDTLAAIALNFGLSHRDIALWNGMTNPDILRVGERLRLTPPENQPVATAVGGKKEQLSLTETGASGASGETTLTPLTPLTPKAPTGGNQGGGESGNVLRPQTTIAGRTGAALTEGGDNSNPGWSGGGGFVKTGPLAEGFVYSKRKLQEMRAEWDSRNAAAPQTAALAPSPTPAPAPAPSTNETRETGTGGGGGPEAVRRAFGIEWSWPARGGLLSGFSDSSRGWDISGEAGDPIYSAADGKVIYAGSGIKGFGRLVIVKHDNDYLSAYAHNRRILMKEGAQVRRGDLIAEMGDSGAERTKLHFEIRKAGKPTDPVEFLPERP